MTSHDDNLPFRLQQARKESGLSQEEAAARLGVTRVTVSNWERGATEPEESDLEKAAKVYGWTPAGLRYGRRWNEPDVAPSHFVVAWVDQTHPDLRPGIKKWLESALPKLAEYGDADSVALAAAADFLVAPQVIAFYSSDMPGPADGDSDEAETKVLGVALSRAFGAVKSELQRRKMDEDMPFLSRDPEVREKSRAEMEKAPTLPLVPAKTKTEKAAASKKGRRRA